MRLTEYLQQADLNPMVQDIAAPSASYGDPIGMRIEESPLPRTWREAQVALARAKKDAQSLRQKIKTGVKGPGAKSVRLALRSAHKEAVGAWRRMPRPSQSSHSDSRSMML